LGVANDPRQRSEPPQEISPAPITLLFAGSVVGEGQQETALRNAVFELPAQELRGGYNLVKWQQRGNGGSDRIPLLRKPLQNNEKLVHRRR